MDHFSLIISLLLFIIFFFSEMISPDMISDHFATNATGNLHQKQQKSDEPISEKLLLNNVSSHVLDIATGRPAKGVKCTAYKWKLNETKSTAKSDGEERGNWQLIKYGETFSETNEQGRIAIVHPGEKLSAGIFKLHFHTKEYFKGEQRNTFYPFIEVIFQIDDPSVHYHVPITLSNFGYSTYKGQ